MSIEPKVVWASSFSCPLNMSVEPTLPMMYWPTEKPFVELEVTAGDMSLASLAFGFTLGFGYFVVCHALRETRRVRRINAYVILIWGEIIVCLIYAIICWLYLAKKIQPSFWFFFFIVAIWAFQIQILLQIIVNRLCIILSSEPKRNALRYGIAAIILAINISVFCIWVPAKLQINHKYPEINVWWDRTEKCMYLLIDGLLNWYFIRTVKQRLVIHGGMKKYAPLVRFNTQIVWVSLGMDVFIIGMMSLRNDFVYMQIHPVAYMVKLNIEMAMSNLIIKVARDTGVNVMEDNTTENSKSISNAGVTVNRFQTTTLEVQVARQQFTTHDTDIELVENGNVWPVTKDEPREESKTSSVDFYNSGKQDGGV